MIWKVCLYKERNLIKDKYLQENSFMRQDSLANCRAVLLLRCARSDARHRQLEAVFGGKMDIEQ